MINIPVVKDHPDSFKTGIRVLMLRARKKDGEENNNQHNARTFITNGVDEFNQKLAELLMLRKGGERIYSTVDPRNLMKGVRIFRERQLANDYADYTVFEKFYLSLHSGFVGCLASPQARDSSLFMIDVDAEDHMDYQGIMGWLDANKIPALYDYATKNGHHIITDPFNPSDCPFQDKIQKNAMMLWAWGITPRGDQGRVIPSKQ